MFQMIIRFSRFTCFVEFNTDELIIKINDKIIIQNKNTYSKIN